MYSVYIYNIVCYIQMGPNSVITINKVIWTKFINSCHNIKWLFRFKKLPDRLVFVHVYFPISNLHLHLNIPNLHLHRAILQHCLPGFLPKHLAPGKPHLGQRVSGLAALGNTPKYKKYQIWQSSSISLYIYIYYIS